ncbi:MAG: hypothetical protein IJ240_09105 [Clostridia bacterium]|nr:hypothetical protein [Clostridia bacterium]
MLLYGEQNRAIIDVTKPPYGADPTGKRDCTEVLRRAIDDGLRAIPDGVEAVRRKLADIGSQNAQMGFENRIVDGKISVLFPETPEKTRFLYFPNGTYLVSDTIA